MKKVVFIGMFLSLAGMVMAQSGKKFLNDAYGAYSNGYYDRAKTAIDKCIEYDDTKAEAKTWLYRGNIYLMIEYMKETKDSVLYKRLCSNCVETAYESYMKARELDAQLVVTSMRIQTPKDGLKRCVEVLVGYSYKAIRDKKDEEAYKWAKMAYQADKSDTDAVFYAGYTADLLKKYDEVKTYYTILTKTKGYRNINPCRRLAEIYQKENDTVKAVRTMRDGMAIYLQDTNFNVDYAVAYSIVMSWAGKSEEATEIMNKAERIDPTNYVILINYGSSLLQEKRYEEAEVRLKRAVELNPKDFIANYNLGNCYLQQAVDKFAKADKLPISESELYEKLTNEGKALYETAKPYVEKAYELEPNDRETCIMLQQIYMRIGTTTDGEKARAKEIGEKIKEAQKK